jgi:hypothetical protein
MNAGNLCEIFMLVILKINCVTSLLRGIPTFYAGKEDKALLGSNLSALPGGVQGMGCPLDLEFGWWMPWCPSNALNPLPLPVRGGGEGGGGYYFT